SQRERLSAELGELNAIDASERIATLQNEEAEARERGEQSTLALRELTEQLQQLRERDRELVSAVDRSRQELQAAQGKLMFLQALQQAALGLAQGKVSEWLSANTLSERPRLAQQLIVEPGWERAVETVLGSYLEAVSVEAIDAIASRLESLQVGTVSFFAEGGASAEHVDSGQLLAR